VRLFVCHRQYERSAAAWRYGIAESDDTVFEKYAAIFKVIFVKRK